MHEVELEKRKQRVLEIIIESYTATASPVGSLTISRKYRLGLSPATIRNIMAELEEEGLLAQPHTSGGRLPTDKGYRFYVDSLTHRKYIAPEDEKRIEREYKLRKKELESLIEETSRILSIITNYAGMVLFPRVSHGIFKRIEIIPISRDKVSVILLTTSWWMNKTIVELREPIEDSELKRLVRLLNNELEGMALYEIEDYILSRLIEEKRDPVFYMFKRAAELFGFSLRVIDDDRMDLDGTSRILEQPEFQDIDRIRVVLKALEDKKAILEIMKQDIGKEGINIHIGRETGYREIEDCSIITASYKMKDMPIGTLGVIGPVRMDYLRTISVVSHISEVLSKMISDIVE